MSLESRYALEEALYTEIGRAISNWSWIEFHLISHFQHALKISRRRAVHILEPVTNFSLSLKIIDAANKDILDDEPQLIYWTSLVGYIRELSSDRNMLAHYPVQSPYTAEHFDIDPQPYVGPTDPEYSAKQARRRLLPLDEVRDLVLDFELAAILLADFSRWRFSNHPSPERFLKPIERNRPGRTERRESDKRE